MKKLLLLVFLSLIALSTLFAEDTLDDELGLYSYTNITSGYGAFITEKGVLNSIDLGFSFNFASMDDSNTFGIGLGSRCDVLFGVGNKNNKAYIGADVLVGPYFHYKMNKIISFNLTVGPVFNCYYSGGSKEEKYTIGPGFDGFITLTPPSFDNISFSVGSLAAVNFSLQNEATAFTVVPYVSIDLHFTKSYYTPYPYGALVIF